MGEKMLGKITYTKHPKGDYTLEITLEGTVNEDMLLELERLADKADATHQSLKLSAKTRLAQREKAEQ